MFIMYSIYWFPVSFVSLLVCFLVNLQHSVSKGSHILSGAFIPGAHRGTFSHCLRCGMSCLLCLSNNSLTMLSHPKGNGCCLTQTFFLLIWQFLGTYSFLAYYWPVAAAKSGTIYFLCMCSWNPRNREARKSSEYFRFLCFINYRTSNASRITKRGSGGTRRTCGQQKYF